VSFPEPWWLPEKPRVEHLYAQPLVFSITVNLIAARLLSGSACVLFRLTGTYYNEKPSKPPTIFEYITLIAVPLRFNTSGAIAPSIALFSV
jgi:hypothetical protein